MGGDDGAVLLCARASAAGSAVPCRRPARCAVSIRHRARRSRSASSAAAATVALPVAGSSIRPLDPGKEHPRLQVAGLSRPPAHRACRNRSQRRRRTATIRGKRRRVGPAPAAAPRARPAPPPGTAAPTETICGACRSVADIGGRQREAGGGLLGAELASAAAAAAARSVRRRRPCRRRCRISTGTRPAFSSNSSRAGGFAACVASTKAVPTLGWPANGISLVDGEDAHLRVMGGIARRQHEGRLGIVELGRDRLHLRGREPAGIQHHGERIAAEGAVGEDVHGDIASLHSYLPFSLSQLPHRHRPVIAPDRDLAERHRIARRPRRARREPRPRSAAANRIPCSAPRAARRSSRCRRSRYIPCAAASRYCRRPPRRNECRCRSAAASSMPSLMRSIASSISRAAATARCAGSSASNGAPNSARKPSPRNLFTMPPWRSRISTSTANAPSSRSTTSCGERDARARGEAAEIDEHHGDLADVAFGAGALQQQPLHHLRRDVLAEQVGDAVARGRGANAGGKSAAQLHADRAGQHAAGEEDQAARQMIVDLRLGIGIDQPACNASPSRTTRPRQRSR